MKLLRFFRIVLLIATALMVGISLGSLEQSKQTKEWLGEK